MKAAQLKYIQRQHAQRANSSQGITAKETVHKTGRQESSSEAHQLLHGRNSTKGAGQGAQAQAQLGQALAKHVQGLHQSPKLQDAFKRQLTNLRRSAQAGGRPSNLKVRPFRQLLQRAERTTDASVAIKTLAKELQKLPDEALMYAAPQTP